MAQSNQERKKDKISTINYNLKEDILGGKKMNLPK